MIRVVLILSLLVGVSCSKKQESIRTEPQQVGDVELIDSMLRDAYRKADPHGAVLVVLWTTDAPPSPALGELTARWIRYGLVTFGVCIDPLRSREREMAVQGVRRWERDHRLDFPGIIFDGDANALARRLQVDDLKSMFILLSEHGELLWVGSASEHLSRLEAAIQSHLGEPSMALRVGLSRCPAIAQS